MLQKNNKQNPLETTNTYRFDHTQTSSIANRSKRSRIPRSRFRHRDPASSQSFPVHLARSCARQIQLSFCSSPVVQPGRELNITVPIGEYFRQVAFVVGEAGLEPWDPMGHIYYGPMQLSCYLVSASRRSLLYWEGTSGEGGRIE